MQGFRDIVPVMVATVPFGLVFGARREAGLFALRSHVDERQRLRWRIAIRAALDVGRPTAVLDDLDVGAGGQPPPRSLQRIDRTEDGTLASGGALPGFRCADRPDFRASGVHKAARD